MVVPFVGSAVSSTSMAHTMSMASSVGTFLGISGSTYFDHIIPGGIVALVGIFQLVLGFMRERRSATAPVTEQSIQNG